MTLLRTEGEKWIRANICFDMKLFDKFDINKKIMLREKRHEA